MKQFEELGGLETCLLCSVAEEVEYNTTFHPFILQINSHIQQYDATGLTHVSFTSDIMTWLGSRRRGGGKAVEAEGETNTLLCWRCCVTFRGAAQPSQPPPAAFHDMEGLISRTTRSLVRAAQVARGTLVE